jgi:integrase
MNDLPGEILGSEVGEISPGQLWCEESGRHRKRTNPYRFAVPKPKGAALHLLRHFHASHQLAQNEALTTVSERLGSSSPRVTADIYSHAITGRDREAAMILGARGFPA